MLWKSAYTGLIHKVKEMCGAWALLECQRVAIPGCYATEEEGELCSRCFPKNDVEDERAM